MSHFAKLFEFVSLIGQLKRVHRTGWVLHNVSDPESVADHMYRMSVLAFLADPGTGLCKERCIKLSLVHDMAECIVGDLAPSHGIDKQEKYRREKTAMTHITSLVPQEVGVELMTLWEEYEEQKSAEARYVKDLDRFDMIFQAYEYEQLENKPGSLQEFFDSSKEKFQTDTVRSWARELERLRTQSPIPTIFPSPQVNRHVKPTEKSVGARKGSASDTAPRESATVKPFSVNNKETNS